MKEKYTITITEENSSINIKNGNVFGILSRICTAMEKVVELAPASICKDRDDRKKLIIACCKAVMKRIDAEKEE